MQKVNNACQPRVHSKENDLEKAYVEKKKERKLLR